MAKKLFHAEVTYHYYFLAEEGKEQRAAEDFMDEAIDNDRTISPDVNEVLRMEHMMDWDDHDLLVYGDHKDDISLKDAFEISTGKTYEQAKKEFHDRMFKLNK